MQQEIKPSVIVTHLSKHFTLSSAQRKKRKSKDKILKAVDDISFDLYPGEIFGLLGPNGAGKTTTLRILATLLKPSGGSVEIEGFNLSKDSEEIRKRIGFLTSELKLDNFFTHDYTFDFFASIYGLDEERRKNRKEFLFQKFGIDEYRYKKIGELSSGMKQKVSLAISLLHDPTFIIYDEPTNGLDIIASKAVEDYLLELKEEGKTIIISTHIMPIIDKLADRIAIMLDGKIAYLGDAKDVKDEGGLENLFFRLYEEKEGKR